MQAANWRTGKPPNSLHVRKTSRVLVKDYRVSRKRFRFKRKNSPAGYVLRTCRERSVNRGPSACQSHPVVR